MVLVAAAPCCIVPLPFCAIVSLKIAMSASKPLPVPASATAGVAQAPRSELTLRAALTSLVVAALMAGSYPYMVLKLGYGPNISVVAAFSVSSSWAL